jgi:hypothetical protein
MQWKSAFPTPVRRTLAQFACRTIDFVSSLLPFVGLATFYLLSIEDLSTFVSSKKNNNGATKMTFTVQQQLERYDVIGYGMILDSFDSEQAAAQEASRMNAEYERVLSVL